MDRISAGNPVGAAARRSRLSLHVLMLLIASAFSWLLLRLAVELSTRLRAETFHQYRLLSEEVVGRLNDDLQKSVSAILAAGGGSTAPSVLTDTGDRERRFLLVAALEGRMLRLYSRQDRRSVGELSSDGPTFFRSLAERIFYESAMGSRSSFQLTDNGTAILALDSSAVDVRSDEFKGTVILRQALAAPFDRFEAVFTAVRIPIAKSGEDARKLVGTLLFLLPYGFGALYLLALKQVDVAEERSRFVSEVSHELRTPLTSIRMYSEMLRDGMVPVEEKKREYASLIASESERLSHLVEDLLDLSRFARGRRHLEMVTEEVTGLVDLVLSRITDMAERRGFELIVERHEIEDRFVVADREAFLRICINVVDNALRYAADSEDKRIVFSVRIEDGSVSFGFRDFGPGFNGRRESPVPAGTGIGLSLAKEAAKRMKGRIKISNQTPGACVELSLPRANPPASG